MKIKFTRLSEITMMSGPYAAADVSMPQAALGQKPSDAYKAGKVKLRKLRRKKKKRS